MPAETGCVIAYRTYEENHAPVGGSNDATGPGMDNACTNPVALGGDEAYLDTYFPTTVNNAIFMVGSKLRPRHIEPRRARDAHPGLRLPAG